jgi:hypothetical protein
MKDIKMGDPADFRNFMGAVIDEKAFDKIASYIDYACKNNKNVTLAGGGYDKERATSSSPPSSSPPIRAPPDVRGDLRAGAHLPRVPGRTSGSRP